MTEHSTLDRLEARLDRQAARLDAVCATLEQRGILPPPPTTELGDALFDELVQIEDSPFASAPAKRHAPLTTKLHVGNATGV